MSKISELDCNYLNPASALLMDHMSLGELIPFMVVKTNLSSGVSPGLTKGVSFLPPMILVISLSIVMWLLVSDKREKRKNGLFLVNTFVLLENCLLSGCKFLRTVDVTTDAGLSQSLFLLL